MHELSLCQALLGQVEAVAQQHRSEGVTRIVLQIGPLAGVEPRLLQEAFPVACAGSVAANAELTIEPLPIRVRCTRCGAESEASANRLLCGACGDWRTQLISGDEMVLASVEMIREQ
jgi:hydrogenase nickel incorporation protein HypA/HybF